MKQKVLLIGGMNKAKALGESLLRKGYAVTLINNNLEDCQSLSENAKFSVVYGDGTKPYVLEDAGAEEMSIAIAMTSRDEDNLVACELCKKRFHVRRVVALVNDPRKTEFFYQMGIDSVVCAISALANIVEQQAFLDEGLPALADGRVRVAEVAIAQSSPVLDKQLWEIHLPKQVIIGCIVREEQTLIPRGDTRIALGDMLVLLSASGQETAAIKELTGE